MDYFRQDGTISLSRTSWSYDGKTLAYGLSKSGSDWISIKFRDIAGMKDYPEELQKVCVLSRPAPRLETVHSTEHTDLKAGRVLTIYTRLSVVATPVLTIWGHFGRLLMHYVGAAKETKFNIQVFGLLPTWGHFKKDSSFLNHQNTIKDSKYFFEAPI